jgi:hypothetical protein
MAEKFSFGCCWKGNDLPTSAIDFFTKFAQSNAGFQASLLPTDKRHNRKKRQQIYSLPISVFHYAILTTFFSIRDLIIRKTDADLLQASAGVASRPTVSGP